MRNHSSQGGNALAVPAGSPLRSSIWSDDAPRRHPGQVVGTPALGGESVPIRATGPTHDLPAAFTSAARGGLPRLVVRHRAFDGEHAKAVVGDDQEEWFDRSNVRHDRPWHARAMDGNNLLQAEQLLRGLTFAAAESISTLSGNSRPHLSLRVDHRPAADPP